MDRRKGIKYGHWARRGTEKELGSESHSGKTRASLGHRRPAVSAAQVLLGSDDRNAIAPHVTERSGVWPSCPARLPLKGSLGLNVPDKQGLATSSTKRTGNSLQSEKWRRAGAEISVWREGERRGKPQRRKVRKKPCERRAQKEEQRPKSHKPHEFAVLSHGPSGETVRRRWIPPAANWGPFHQPGQATTCDVQWRADLRRVRFLRWERGSLKLTGAKRTPLLLGNPDSRLSCVPDMSAVSQRTQLLSQISFFHHTGGGTFASTAEQGEGERIREEERQEREEPSGLPSSGKPGTPEPWGASSLTPAPEERPCHRLGDLTNAQL